MVWRDPCIFEKYFPQILEGVEGGGADVLEKMKLLNSWELIRYLNLLRRIFSTVVSLLDKLFDTTEKLKI